MNITQLRYLCEVVERGFNISAAAKALHTSQPGISMQIQRLERELGVQIFVRRNNRLVGITAAGKAVLQRSRRAVHELDGIRAAAREQIAQGQGVLTIATNHIQATYALPKAIHEFKGTHPGVEVVVRESLHGRVREMLESGQADLAIMSDAEHLAERLALIPCVRHRKLLIVPSGHPLARNGKPGLEEVARYDLIVGQHPRVSDYLLTAFRQHGVNPKIALRVPNADVMKVYVKAGLGVAIILGLAYDARRDKGIRAIDLTSMLAPSTTYVLLDKNHFHQRFVFDFIGILNPGATRQHVESVLLD